MKETNYDVNLANISDIFDNKTFRYRINGFAQACGMEDMTIFKNSGLVFTTPKANNYDIDENKHSYFISVNENSKVYGKSITLNGQYEDLFFTFINQCGNKVKLDKKIIDVPFYISLEKKIDNDTYKFEIETVEGMRTKFYMAKYTELKGHTLHDDLCFYANVMDFSKILKLVKGFVYNPQLCFNTYSEMVHQQKIVFTNNMLDKMVMQDEKLDKPKSKIKKIMQRILNSD